MSDADQAVQLVDGWVWCSVARRPVHADDRDLPTEPCCENEYADHPRLLLEGIMDAPIAAALALAIDIASDEPTEVRERHQLGSMGGVVYREEICRYCGGSAHHVGGTMRHEPTCLWRRATEITEEMYL